MRYLWPFILAGGSAFGLALFGLIMMMLILTGCAAPSQDYRPVPLWLIPIKPAVPTIKGEALSCLSDAAYQALVERDRQCWQYARELRALLGPGND